MFNSIMNDMSIEAEKYIDHSSGIPGYAEYYFNVNVNDVRKKSFKSFEELVKYLEEIIPQEELDANKYNL
jgi:DNA primase catalytic subunit